MEMHRIIFNWGIFSGFRVTLCHFIWSNPLERSSHPSINNRFSFICYWKYCHFMMRGVLVWCFKYRMIEYIKAALLHIDSYYVETHIVFILFYVFQLNLGLLNPSRVFHVTSLTTIAGVVLLILLGIVHAAHRVIWVWLLLTRISVVVKANNWCYVRHGSNLRSCWQVFSHDFLSESDKLEIMN